MKEVFVMKKTERTLECTAAQVSDNIPEEIVIITLFQCIDLVREGVTADGGENDETAD